jgi:hypothetical protein
VEQVKMLKGVLLLYCSTFTTACPTHVLAGSWLAVPIIVFP